jgi:cytochrome b
VWDLPLRLFHWLFVLSICGSYTTAKAGVDWMQFHFYFGYFMLGLLIFRIVWGFIGPQHARFSSFLTGPSTVITYARGLFGPAAHVSVGHNPLGGLMVLVMLILVAVQATTGLFTTDTIIWTGPYYPAVSSATSSFLSGVHEINFNIILAAVALHLAAIIYYHWVKKQNLVSAMFTGYKPAATVPEHLAIPGSQLFKALVVGLVAAGIVYMIVTKAPPPPDSPF